LDDDFCDGADPEEVPESPESPEIEDEPEVPFSKVGPVALLSNATPPARFAAIWAFGGAPRRKKPRWRMTLTSIVEPL
jgi:hypothetical protein